MTIVGSTGAMEHRCLVAGEDLVLACELSRPDATVRWLRDGQEVQAGERVQMEVRGVRRQLTIHGVQPGDSGCYICDAASDCVVTSVEVSGEPAGAQWDHAALLGEGRGRLCDPADSRGQGSSMAGESGSPVPSPSGAVGQKGTRQGHGKMHPSCLPQPGAG